jgi:hypothetical protein
MATIRRRTLVLHTQKELKLFGNSLAINTAFEIGEGSAPNIFGFLEQLATEEPVQELMKEIGESKTTKPRSIKKSMATVSNPYKLTAAEIEEIADFNIRLWLDLKDSIRKYGVTDTRVFNKEALR